MKKYKWDYKTKIALHNYICDYWLGTINNSINKSLKTLKARYKRLDNEHFILIDNVLFNSNLNNSQITKFMTNDFYSLVKDKTKEEIEKEISIKLLQNS